MEHVAIIDLGTNTFNMLVAEVLEGKKFKRVFSHRIPVMLGEGTINSNLISPAPFKRGLEALAVFKSELDKYAVNKVIALATSAIRSATNGKEFVKAVQESTGIEVQAISGDKEAELIYIGNAEAANLGEQNSLIMDIGGGSTEFIIGNGQNMVWEKSFMLGAARLLDKFKPEDPILPQTIERVFSFFDEELKDLFNALEKNPINELIGSSGAFDSFAEMIDAEYNSMQFSEQKICYAFDMAEFEEMYKRVIKSTLDERKRMKGLLLMRVEMIVISFLFTFYILKKCKIQHLRSTTWSLKEGALLQYLRTS